MPLAPGSPAPDFSLVDQYRKKVSLGDLAGRRALVVFIPYPFTGVCRRELCELRDNLAALQDLDAHVVAITCDTQPANSHWAKEEGFTFPVLSDFWPHGEVARAYDTFNDTFGYAERTTYVLDAEGVITDVFHSDSLGTPRDFEQYQKALAAQP